MDRVLKVATPLTAFTVFVPLNVPLLGFVAMATVTEAVLVVRFPLTSCICTVTAGVIVLPPPVLVGCCKKASLLAVPAFTLNRLLVPDFVLMGSVAVMVLFEPACVRVTLSVRTPPTKGPEPAGPIVPADVDRFTGLVNPVSVLLLAS